METKVSNRTPQDLAKLKRRKVPQPTCGRNGRDECEQSKRTQTQPQKEDPKSIVAPTVIPTFRLRFLHTKSEKSKGGWKSDTLIANSYIHEQYTNIQLRQEADSLCQLTT